VWLIDVRLTVYNDIDASNIYLLYKCDMFTFWYALKRLPTFTDVLGAVADSEQA
jgi:hypothetical protein